MTIGLVHILAGDVKKIHQRFDTMQESLQETLSIHVDATNAHFDHLQKQADKADKHDEKTDSRLGRMETALAQILEHLPEKP
jgi:exonuclease VII large subunit